MSTIFKSDNIEINSEKNIVKYGERIFKIDAYIEDIDRLKLRNENGPVGKGYLYPLKSLFGKDSVEARKFIIDKFPECYHAHE